MSCVLGPCCHPCCLFSQSVIVSGVQHLEQVICGTSYFYPNHGYHLILFLLVFLLYLVCVVQTQILVYDNVSILKFCYGLCLGDGSVSPL